MLASLDRSGRRDAFRPVWLGCFAALLASAAIAALLFSIGAELEGTAGAAFEGSTMLLAAGCLTWMVFWMRRHARSLRSDLEAQVRQALTAGSTFGLGLVAFVAVAREGIETALFLLGVFEGAGTALSSVSAAIGLTFALVLGYLFYRGSSRLDVRRFFMGTSIVLLLLAGWLLAGGLHELAEEGIIPESELGTAIAFVALAAPALYVFFRPHLQRQTAR